MEGSWGGTRSGRGERNWEDWSLVGKCPTQLPG
jgi:hypothetical protein